ncbi:MAG: DUF1428 domain-containing protein [Candidatus Koribacter versatilis]|uniref:DUF1428 domain-containing protein n=1 Tax=Candidatus Korobacter versatilis TaxID=658062 RepID=A0A932EQJ8_9BACT|nr:DUF1428 domain-containing protein [Candidatus Koribacter versatilis]
MPYVDGFLLPVPKKNVAGYRRMAAAAGKIFRKHGAIEFRECAGDDLNNKGMLPFPRAVRAKRGETVFFSYVVYKSRADRDRANAKIMKDPAIAKMMKKKPLFDAKRMYYGGFKVLVDA